MSRNNRTKDENYILSLHEEAVASGDPQGSIDRYKAGDRAHLYPKAADTICKLLVQANFIKKDGEVNVYLTPHGLKLIERLKMDKST